MGMRRRIEDGAKRPALPRECTLLLYLLVRLMNKAVILALVLLIAALTPATAIIGFCARMPCCEADETAGSHEQLTTPSASCCTSINCYEAPEQEAARASFEAKMTGVTLTPATLLLVPSTLLAPTQFSDSSPPRPARERLSILSILLI